MTLCSLSVLTNVTEERGKLTADRYLILSQLERFCFDFAIEASPRSWSLEEVGRRATAAVARPSICRAPLCPVRTMIRAYEE